MLEQHIADRGLKWPVCALITATLIGLLGPIRFDLDGTLPLSLQSLLVCWLPLMFGWRAGVLGVLVYLAAGALGLPVFAGHRGGMAVLAGPTGGYLLGMAVAALISGVIGSESQTTMPDRVRYLRVIGGMLLGHIVILAMGIPWQRAFAPDLDIAALLHKLYRPALLKSALGLLLTVVVFRATQTRA